jgi:hypothetical protein
MNEHPCESELRRAKMRREELRSAGKMYEELRRA